MDTETWDQILDKSVCLYMKYSWEIYEFNYSASSNG